MGHAVATLSGVDHFSRSRVSNLAGMSAVVYGHFHTRYGSAKLEGACSQGAVLVGAGRRCPMTGR